MTVVQPSPSGEPSSALLAAATVGGAVLMQPLFLVLCYGKSSPLPLPAIFDNVLFASTFATLLALSFVFVPVLWRRRNLRLDGTLLSLPEGNRVLTDLREMMAGLARQASLLRLREGDDPELKHLLKQIDVAVDRAAALATQLAESQDRPKADFLERKTPLHDASRRMVLVLDEDSATRRQVREILAVEGWQVVAVHTAELALDVFQSHRGELALIVVAWDHGGLDGPEILATFRRIDGQLPLIVLSSLDLDPAEVSCLVRGPGGHLQKPITNDELTAAVRRCTRQLH